MKEQKTIAPYFIGDVDTRWLHPSIEEIAGYKKLTFLQKLKHNWRGLFSRKMELLSDFAFVDKYGVKWEAMKGTVVDGSSIPRWLWPFIGSPFVGMHRRASVLHDPACVIKNRPYEQVHQMYEDACIADGVIEAKAKTMHKAIKLGGPRWKPHPQRRKGI